MVTFPQFKIFGIRLFIYTSMKVKRGARLELSFSGQKKGRGEGGKEQRKVISTVVGAFST